MDRLNSTHELLQTGPQPTYPGAAREAAFLLGGIGTGNVSVGARGELRDWEIFNHPAKGLSLPYTFFAIRAQADGQAPVVKVLESKLHPPFSKSHGFHSHELAGLPRFESSTLRGEYPFAWVDLHDTTVPVQVRLEAFTPFIPLDADASGMPAALLRYIVTNPTSAPVEVSVAGSLANLAGFDRINTDPWRGIALADEGKNEFRDDNAVRGLYYSCAKLTPDHLRYGTMALVTPDTQVTHKRQWLSSGGWDGAHDFWDDFCSDGRLEPESSYVAKNVGGSWGVKIGSLALTHKLQPGEQKRFEFILAWHYPNRPKSWNEPNCACGADCKTDVVQNYYARLWRDAWHAAAFLNENLPRLENASRDFHRALFDSTLPAYVIDALASNITVVRSTTCFRLHDGTLLGWEGCFDSAGCCDGTCTHVWNYAQTLAFLFPELEQTMRRVEFGLETGEDGKMAFRSRQVFGEAKWDFHPAADGQMGTIVRLYREWKLSGNGELVRSLWPQVVRALDFAFTYWDSDGDCVLDSQQHNTYDIEFYGPNSLVNSIFFAALKAASEMADFLGDTEHATRYRQALETGAPRMDQMLWGGQYYIQQIADVDEYRYQYGQGCLSDQLLGQLLAHVAGLGYILPEEHVKAAIHSVYRYNFRQSLADHHNVQRTYALGDEPGLLLCSWPNGGRPKLPFIYSDEVWTGIEYQVAAHLIYEGFIEEGLTIVRAVRPRHDGYARNPWNEVECGHHYARSLASWAVLPALSGFRYDMVAGTMSFDPKIHTDDFRCFWSTGKAWGIFRQKKNPSTGQLEQQVEVLYGSVQPAPCSCSCS